MIKYNIHCMDNGTPVARYRYKEVTLKLYVMSMHFSIFTFELSEWWSGEYTKDSQSAIFRILKMADTQQSRTISTLYRTSLPEFGRSMNVCTSVGAEPAS